MDAYWEAKAKVTRARLHAADLNNTIRKLIAEEPAVEIRLTEIDDQGKHEAHLQTGARLHEIRMNVTLIAGDCYHNLRCALDYLVTGLCDRSGVEVTNRHGFPILSKPSAFRKKVWRGEGYEPNENGALGGITVGLDLVEKYQPYNTHPDNPFTSPLASLRELSNQDKHRALPILAFNIGKIELDLQPKERLLKVDARRYELDLDTPDPVVRIQWREPYPDLSEVVMTVMGYQLTPIIGAMPLGQDRAVGHLFNYFSDICDSVDAVIESFKPMLELD